MRTTPVEFELENRTRAITIRVPNEFAEMTSTLGLGSMADAPQAEPNSKRYGLTGRELDIVAAIVEGLTNKEIAQKFSISEQTVKHHLSSVFDKVGVSNRLELALFSVAHRLLEKAR